MTLFIEDGFLKSLHDKLQEALKQVPFPARIVHLVGLTDSDGRTSKLMVVVERV